jgi:predicted DNA-binding transcriptional regulator AlpA
MNGIASDLLTTKELCERLKITRQALQNWRDKGIMPLPLRVPGRAFIRWRWSEIEAWLQQDPKNVDRR